MSKIKIKLPDGSEAVINLGGISEAVAKAILSAANSYTDQKVKGALLDIPSGSNVIVDQEYSPNSKNPQSGVAVAQAVDFANRYTDEEIEELRKEIPSGEITEEEKQEIISLVPDEIDVTDDPNADMPETAIMQIVIDDEELLPVDGVFAEMVKAALNKETWTFTLEDGTTVQKVVYVE